MRYPYLNMCIFDMPGEIWARTADPDFLISNMGRVKRRGFVKIGKDGRLVTVKPLMIKQMFYSGAVRVALEVNARDLNLSVAKLVARAFLTDYDIDKNVYHINGDAKDNRLCNLTQNYNASLSGVRATESPRRVKRLQKLSRGFINVTRIKRVKEAEHMNDQERLSLLLSFKEDDKWVRRQPEKVVETLNEQIKSLVAKLNNLPCDT